MRGITVLVLLSVASAFQPLKSIPLPTISRGVHSGACLRKSAVAPRTRVMTSMGLLDDFKNLPNARVLEAASRGGRFTAADVSARAGCSLEEAKEALTAVTGLLGGAGAALEVSQTGELVFNLPPQPAQLLAARNQAAGLRANLEAAKPQLFTALRVLFGVGLLVSLAAVYSAIFFISANSSEGQRDDRRRNDRGYGGGGGFGGGGFGPTLYLGPSPFDVLYYRPYYGYGYSRRAALEQGPPEMGLLEAVYSYVFGDGDPNTNLDARAVAAAARVIRANGGAVTAQQLLPFVPAPPSLNDPSMKADREAGLGLSSVVDEQFVLPIVTRLQGVAQVSPTTGGIVYTFDDVVVTAASAAEEAADDLDFEDVVEEATSRLGYLEEQTSEFTAASGLNAFLAPALGFLNLFGVVYLGAQLGSLPPGAVLPGVYGLIQGLYPLLVAYAIAFNAAPAVRALKLSGANAAVEARNDARRAAAAQLARPSAELRAQLAAARKMGAGGAKRVGGSVGDVAYSTDDRGASQLEASKRDNELSDFDRRLGKK